MTKTALKSVTKLLSELNPEELTSTRLTLDFLLKGVVTPIKASKSSIADGGELCFETFRRTLKTFGLNCPPFSIAKRMELAKHFSRHYPMLATYIKTQFPSSGRTKRQKLYRLFAELLLIWMRKNHVPMKIGLFFRNLGLIPELMTKAFPGYAEQGWLPLILTLGQRNAKDRE